uniref:Glutamate ionotropic receptor NMDA type subunit 2C n=1 Tax=Hucho hucho TaxID=62062 RepID=A0A4W5N695_9TELE
MAAPPGQPPPSLRYPPLFLLFLLLFLSSPPPLLSRPLIPHPSINVAVVFCGSAYQNEVRGHLSREDFTDLPLEVNPVTVLVNDTNPRALLTRLCETMAAEKLHGVVFEDDVAEVAQILDFLSTQTALPIVGISGGSTVVIPHKVRQHVIQITYTVYPSNSTLALEANSTAFFSGCTSLSGRTENISSPDLVG